MTFKRFCCLIFLLASSVACAQGQRPVPSTLFGVPLGGIYDIGDLDSKDYGKLPVKKGTGVQRFMGQGVHYYFQPSRDTPEFPYLEKPKKPGEKYFETSFRLYLFPLIPPTITSAKQLEGAKLKWEVALIAWQDEDKSKDSAYYWAADLCRTFTVDIAVKPKVLDDFKDKWFKCTFSAEDREFTVQNTGNIKSVSLEFKNDVFEKKNESIDVVLRKLRANQIRPY